MRKQITITMLAIMMLAGTMAMYAGDTISFETNITEPVYAVTGNSSNLDGLNITFEDGNITISPALNYKPDNFTLIFYDNVTKEVIKTIYRRSSGSTRYIYENVTIVEEIIIEWNATADIECDACNETDVVKKIPKEYGFWKYIFWILGGIIILYIIFKLIELFRY